MSLDRLCRAVLCFALFNWFNRLRGGFGGYTVALSACRADLAAVWVAQYKVWPLVDWFNFTYVPEPLRVILELLPYMCWDTIQCNVVLRMGPFLLFVCVGECLSHI
jgi:hypothetical protein